MPARRDGGTQSPAFVPHRPSRSRAVEVRPLLPRTRRRVDIPTVDPDRRRGWEADVLGDSGIGQVDITDGRARPPRTDTAKHDPRPDAREERHELGPDPELKAVCAPDPDGVGIDGLAGRTPTKHDIADGDVAAAACDEPIDDQSPTAGSGRQASPRPRGNLERNTGLRVDVVHDGPAGAAIRRRDGPRSRPGAPSPPAPRSASPGAGSGQRRRPSAPWLGRLVLLRNLGSVDVHEPEFGHGHQVEPKDAAARGHLDRLGALARERPLEPASRVRRQQLPDP